MGTKYGRRHGLGELRSGTRELATTYGRPATPIASDKFPDRGLLLVEHQAEQLVAQALTIDPRVQRIEPQGLTVDLVERTVLLTLQERQAAAAKYRGMRGPNLFTVDFVADLIGPAHRAVEVKLDEFPGDDEYQEMLQDAAAVLGRFGYALLTIVIPADQRKPIWSNVPLVAQACIRKDLWPQGTALRSIESAQQSGARTAREFLDVLELHVNHLPVLVACGALSHDLLGDHLKGGSLVQAARGDLSHLHLIDRLAK